MEYHLSYNSALGFLNLKSDGEAVTGITFSEHETQETDHPCALLQECKNQLEAYFDGKTLEFDLPLSPSGTPFQQRVWAELMKIPKGETITYHELAMRLGDPRMVRAVGTANGRNPVAIVIPCHRVVGAGNKLTGYAWGVNRKLWLLDHERKHQPLVGKLF